MGKEWLLRDETGVGTGGVGTGEGSKLLLQTTEWEVQFLKEWRNLKGILCFWYFMNLLNEID